MSFNKEINRITLDLNNNKINTGDNKLFQSIIPNNDKSQYSIIVWTKTKGKWMVLHNNKL